MRFRDFRRDGVNPVLEAAAMHLVEMTVVVRETPSGTPPGK
jgi:hypothetical protein